MPNKKEKQSTTKEKSITSSSRNPGRKAPGTRVGTLNDWRQASANSGKPANRHGHTVRDGR